MTTMYPDLNDWLHLHYIPKKMWERLAIPHHKLRYDWGAPLVVGKKWVDIGCVLGHATQEMNLRRPGDWTGFDIHEEMVTLAKKNFPELKFQLITNLLELPEKCFDTVWCTEVIEHIPDWETFAAGLLHITGQRLLLTTPSRWISDPGHLRVFSQAELARLFPGATVAPLERYWSVVWDRPENE